MISVVVPVYNKQNSIKRCIESVLKQSYISWELLLIDDGSTDNSAKIIQPYLKDNRIHYYHKENGGVSSARNMGILKAKGEWIIFLDSDDYFLQNCLEILLNVVATYKTKIGVGNYFQECASKRMRMCVGKEGIVNNNFRAWYMMDCIPRAGTALFCASILKEHLFDEGLSRYEDAKSLFEIMRIHSMAYTPCPVMVYSLDDLCLSRKAKNIHADYIFGMEFSQKSFWERMILIQLLKQGLRLYPDHKNELISKYEKFMYLTKIEGVLNFICRIIRKYKRCFLSISK